GGADNPDDVGALVDVDRLAETADVHVNRSQFYIAVLTPDGIEQPLAGEYPVGMLQKMTQKPELGRSERNCIAVAFHLVTNSVHFQITEHQLFTGKGRAYPAQNGFHSGYQFAWAERLCDIIIRSGFQAADFILFLTASGQHDDWNIGCFR